MSTPRAAKPEIFLPMDLEVQFNPKVQGIDYGVLDHLMGYAVRRAQIVQYEHFIKALASWQITPPRFSAMVIIARNPGLKLTVLSNVLGIARSGAVALINSLEGLDYVMRVPSPTDRRALGLELTAQGAAVLPAIVKAAIQQDRQVIQALSAQDQAQLMVLLGKISGFRADAAQS